MSNDFEARKLPQFRSDTHSSLARGSLDPPCMLWRHMHLQREDRGEQPFVVHS